MKRRLVFLLTLLLASALCGDAAAGEKEAAARAEKKDVWRLQWRHMSTDGSGNGYKGYAEFKVDPDKKEIRGRGPVVVKAGPYGGNDTLHMKGKREDDKLVFTIKFHIDIATPAGTHRVDSVGWWGGGWFTLPFEDGAMKKVYTKNKKAVNVFRLRGPTEKWEVEIDQWNELLTGSFGNLALLAGIEAHWRRTITFEVSGGKVKNAKCRNKLVGTKPVSHPPGAYKVTELHQEVIGTGTAVEAERYDQVRHAKRFHPDHMTKKDAELKKEWEKIKKHKTPRVFPEGEFSVSVKKLGKKKAQICLGKESGAVVSFRAVLNEKAAAKANPDLVKFDQLKGARKKFTATDRFYVPGGVRITVPLQDGWKNSRSFKTMVTGTGYRESVGGRNVHNRETIKVKRLK